MILYRNFIEYWNLYQQKRVLVVAIKCKCISNYFQETWTKIIFDEKVKNADGNFVLARLTVIKTFKAIFGFFIGGFTLTGMFPFFDEMACINACLSLSEILENLSFSIHHKRLKNMYVPEFIHLFVENLVEIHSSIL